MNTLLTRTAGTVGALLLCAAPLTTGASATAAPHGGEEPSPTATKPGVPGSLRPTLSAKATVKSIRAWQQFRVYGSSTRLPAGTRVTLQQLQRRGWVSLPIHMNTTRAHTYNLRVKLGIKGLNKIRIIGGGAISNTVQVTIR
ncbi:hypothetical protein [Streptomyces sp. NPDC051561]|uniref:hypothetical protein n=1 Tax=Streptomyces sp. NPDC051561 TaxID=3365658 RepID=UPI0037B3645C